MKTTELTDIDGDALTITQRLDGTWITCTKGDEEVTIGPVPTDAIRHAFETPMGDDLADGGVTAAAIEKEAATISPELLEAALAAAIKDTRELTRERDDARGDCNDALHREKAEQDRAEKAEQERDNKAAAYDQLKILFGDTERAAIRWRDRAQAAEASAEQPRPLTAREHLDAAWDAARTVTAGTAIAPGIGFITRYEGSGQILASVEGHSAVLPARGIWGERRLLDPPAPTRPEGAQELDEWLRQANYAALGGSLDADQRRTLADHLAGLGVRAGGDR